MSSAAVVIGALRVNLGKIASIFLHFYDKEKEPPAWKNKENNYDPPPPSTNVGELAPDLYLHVFNSYLGMC